MVIKKRKSVPVPGADEAPERLVIVAKPKRPIPDDSVISDMYGDNPTPQQMRRVGPVAAHATAGRGVDDSLTIADRVALMRTAYDKNNPSEQRYRNRVRNRGTAITAMCVVCSGGIKNVTECLSITCPLWAFRFGGDPFYKRSKK